MTEADGARRKYESPVRRAQVAATRERIVAAGSELLHGFPIWNWDALTMRAVAERAEVSERTVYRYFPTERDLRDAVMARLEEEAGVRIEELGVEEIQDVAARILEYVSMFPVEPRTPPDPTFAEAAARQRDALLAAVSGATDGWSDRERARASAVLDVLWSPASYERMVSAWQLDPEEAIAAITWAISLVQRGLAEAPPPGPVAPAREGRAGARTDR